MLKQTPDLSKEFHPMPKPNPKGKKAKKPLGAGRKTENWNDGRQELKQTFRENGIVKCEIKTSKCVSSNFLGFAHTRRRNRLTDEQIVDPHYVVLACQPCHDMADFKMDRDEAEEMLDNIVKDRGW